MTPDQVLANWREKKFSVRARLRSPGVAPCVGGLRVDSIRWIAGLHAAAAIYHRLVLKDGVLGTMLPYRWFRR